MKILILNDVGAPHGGAERITLSLRDGLRACGHDARVFASSAHSEAGPTEADYSCFGTVGSLRTLNRIANFSAFMNLRRTLLEFRPDVVHVRMFLSQLSPLILPLLRDVPAVYHAAWYEAVCPTGLKLLPDRSVCHHRAGAVCLRSGCLSARAWAPLMLQMKAWDLWHGVFDRIVANSESVRTRLLEAGVGPVDVVWNGVREVSPRPPLRSPPTITCAARLTSEKGIDVLIRAFASVVRNNPQARLIIAGSGPEEAALRNLVTDLQLEDRVCIVGHVHHGKLERLLGSGWVHAMPSLCAETFGMSAAEAMMRGTAVVASGHGGVAELVVDGVTGRLVAPGDVAALAEALASLLADRKLAQKMGENGRERAKALMNHEAWIGRFIDVYRSLLSEPGTVNLSRLPVSEVV